jgi:transposase-like protein
MVINIFYKIRRFTMKKAIVLLLVIALLGLALASCEKEVVTYCPSCSKASIKEISEVDKINHVVSIHYKCTSCGFTFIASKL